MTRPRTALVFSLPLAFLALGCESSTTPLPTDLDLALAKSPNAPVNWASGGGTVDVPDGRSTYAFHASLDGTGNVNGGFEIHFSSVDANTHGDVTCFVVEGNRAWFGGVVTGTSDPTLVPLGREFVWRAEDNGQGANAPPDRVSSYFSGVWTAGRCAEKPLFPTREWTNGNVQIR